MSDSERVDQDEAPQVRAQQILGDILERMGIEADILVHEEEDRYRLEIECEQADVIVGRRGQVLDALQHLVGKILFRGRGLGEAGAPRKPIVVDADNYRERHAEKLRSLAERMAAKAIETQRPVAIDPMSPHDRRIMHMALADRPDVSTRSEGEGDDRHMLIVPEAEAGQPAGDATAE